MEWDGVIQYGYIFAGDGTVMGNINFKVSYGCKAFVNYIIS